MIRPEILHVYMFHVLIGGRTLPRRVETDMNRPAYEGPRGDPVQRHPAVLRARLRGKR
jgi:hypothetical protein